jgi:hypothetical protein
MFPCLESILQDLHPCFSRQAAFEWLVMILIGLLIRCDHLGLTSIVRWLFLTPESDDLIWHFFRATSWQLDSLLSQWAHVAFTRYPRLTFAGRTLMLADGIKLGKEARRMPALKTLHQDSDTTRKAPYIRGPHFGFVGLLVGSLTKAFCLPLRGQLYEGIAGLRQELGWQGQPATIVTRMAHLVVWSAQQMKARCDVALDAYFATGPAFGIFKAALHEAGQPWVHLITRAKDNYVAYFDWEADPPSSKIRTNYPSCLSFVFLNSLRRLKSRSMGNRKLYLIRVPIYFGSPLKIGSALFGSWMGRTLTS